MLAAGGLQRGGGSVTWNVLHVSDLDHASSQSLADLRALLLLFADEVAKLARGTRGQGGAPIISRLGDGLERDQDPHFLSPSSGLTSCSCVGGSRHYLAFAKWPDHRFPQV